MLERGRALIVYSRNSVLGVNRNHSAQQTSIRGILTVGKKPRVKTLSRLVFPQAPSPTMTSFLFVAA